MLKIPELAHWVHNYSPRLTGTIPIGVVVHCTTGGPDWDAALKATLDWFDNPKSEASAHIVIARDGLVYRCVADKYMAWHAGLHNRPFPDWLIPGNPNDWTLGAELVGNPDDYEPIQLDVLVMWVKAKAKEHWFPQTNVCAHSDLYSQKDDPGPATMAKIREMLGG